MSTDNIYAAPKTQVENETGLNKIQQHGFADGKYFCVRKKFESPPYCYVTGEPVGSNTKTIKLRVSHFPPLAFLLIFGHVPGWIILVFLMVFLQKTIQFKIYLSEEQTHKFKRNKRNVLLFSIVSVCCLFGNIEYRSELGTWIGAILLLISIIWAYRINRLARYIDYKNKFFVVSGAHPHFLAQLPQIKNNGVRDGDGCDLKTSNHGWDGL